MFPSELLKQTHRKGVYVWGTNPSVTCASSICLCFPGLWPHNWTHTRPNPDNLWIPSWMHPMVLNAHHKSWDLVHLQRCLAVPCLWDLILLACSWFASPFLALSLLTLNLAAQDSPVRRTRFFRARNFWSAIGPCLQALHCFLPSQQNPAVPATISSKDCHLA